jgi:DNA polymerase-1
MFGCTNVFSVWDKRKIRGVKNYRRVAKEVEYKGTRDEEKNKKVFSFEDDTTELLKYAGVKNVYPGILEADDVISWLCDKIEDTKVVVSVDQDMLQLVNDSTIVYSPIKNVIIDESNFQDVTGVPKHDFLRYKSLVGDKSDNLPGVDRCGPKTAQKLLKKCHTDAELVEEVGKDRIQPYLTNLKLIDLKEGHKQHPEDVQIYEQQYQELSKHQPDFQKFEECCDRLGMRKTIADISTWKQVFQPTQLNETLQDIVNKLDLHK